jgi:type I restriction enzyme S subunit
MRQDLLDSIATTIRDYRQGEIPLAAKMQSKPHRQQTRSDWEEVKVRIMRWCLRIKLAQNWSAFRDLLLSTGDADIVEVSSRDDFWGAIPESDEVFVGHNVLGRLLGELREDLHQANAEKSLRCVEPVPIRDFHLYGEPIESIRSKDLSDEPISDPDLTPPETALWRLSDGRPA